MTAVSNVATIVAPKAAVTTMENTLCSIPINFSANIDVAEKGNLIRNVFIVREVDDTKRSSAAKTNLPTPQRPRDTEQRASAGEAASASGSQYAEDLAIEVPIKVQTVEGKKC
jgi:hypothetical protein